jgi:crotonobetainyl-CoA:carnitine CoA-transferase CaiB-like acyl-CoA transferase
MVLAPTSRLCQRDDHVPRLGEHTRDVMRGIGWSDEQIAALE